ncbi:hypothetical protein ALP66_03906 [Pseudomonas amygdali pv. photiniae]|uniref:Uncharacterized protein n=1 Tax=Pseudomonas amygdali pv. photiniae TaxID=251724 RepID=A0A658KB84_PSEA0|nr:hypothetical protein ALP66_03906 [Pseudomonas amygdali pv. photiniae]
MELLVILHTAQGDVRTRYPRHKQAQAIAHWQEYAATGKKASLMIDPPSSSGLLSGS